MPGVSCSSRHSRKSRAATPGGSSFCTMAKRLLRQRQAARAPALGSTMSSSRALQIAVGVEVVDDPVGHAPAARARARTSRADRADSLAAIAAGPPCWPWRRACGRLPLRSRVLRRARALLEVVGPLLVHVQQPLEIVLVVLAFVDDQLALFLASARRGSRRSTGLPRADRDLPPTRSSTGFSCISCSMRSCKAMIGNCRISIDWIIRGASTCFWTIRSS